ncbi:MAG: RNA polymerase sigma factor [Flavobacteriales bacterium]
MEAEQQAVFLKLINENRAIIHKVVNLYVDDDEDRKDIVQEIIAQAFAGFHNFRGDAKFSTWLYKVSLNTALTAIKKQKRRDEAEQSIETPTMPEENEKAELLYRAIKMLDPINKMIISLHLEGYENPEISEIAGISINHVAVKLHRSKEKIKSLIFSANGRTQ